MNSKVVIAVAAVVIIVCAGAGAALVMGNNASKDGVVNYHGNGGKSDTGLDIMTAKSHEVMPNIFEKEGYRFIGWNTASDGTGKTYVENDTIDFKSGETVDLYAMWGHMIELRISSPLGYISFYYGNEQITYSGTVIPDKGPITLNVKVPTGATNLTAGLTSYKDDDGVEHEYYAIVYDLEKDGVTNTYTNVINIYAGDAKCTPTYKVVDGEVEITFDYDNVDVKIYYLSGCKEKKS